MIGFAIVVVVPCVLFVLGVAALRWNDRRHRKILVGFDFSDPVGGAAVVMEHDDRTGMLTILGHHAIPAADITGATRRPSNADPYAHAAGYGEIRASEVDVRKLLGPIVGYWEFGRDMRPWWKRVFRGRR